MSATGEHFPSGAVPPVLPASVSYVDATSAIPSGDDLEGARGERQEKNGASADSKGQGAAAAAVVAQ
ncbi:hypothetical protein Slin14017_G012070 [Septoria linicola]|nr:hypothetical protein Slin14017_G012070 [Septoria linicola]